MREAARSSLTHSLLASVMTVRIDGERQGRAMNGGIDGMR